ncbi:hypothetical protein SAMN04487857_102524 [Pseudomonas sp. ok272]|uniref:Pathogenicity locus n=1 Tax=unclassified Pseudomonas TaxID=196821 RepID=UPI0008C3D38F|nr:MULTISPECIES: Pathogenicity locus [unclassified Pseudomonas]SEM54209.1 hypothetical protein SAMN04487857_102524 [Pseudomonas sp. ok272]SFM25997.1 hypothetical protein SAMN04487858_101526 [Pseudomonas sp. ok602]
MHFSPEQAQSLLTVKGVGPTVIRRLEQLGITTLAQLSQATTGDIVTQAAALVGSTCWKNSPQARAAIDAAIHHARQACGHI